ncbi:D-glycero-beta-D-manno-heptose 1-phosphate adenylyltransferase [Thermocrinis minervae]|uniref:D-glycero-beta-D-manno-heptose 1-phosphate adenylyltransferase n=1 Tax=Thermocrinis minervae TaxID=381751 RepID=A0A1M6QBP6_9AQUI|nr:D-glycero-beta-D-manno-heptose 1-phosphate adenylyltransferase [Thermocrinis minervae]SHK17575.1 rfaE bifunctional protein, domain II [Thermocrinis minervae]
MILNLEDLLRILESERKGKVVVFTNGCFDILHAGHVSYLTKAKSFGDILIVAINSDESIRRIKGPKRPIIPQHMRAYVVNNLKPVDYVVIFEEDTPEKLIRAIRPDVLVKGEDWDIHNIVGADFVMSYGGRVERVPFEFDISTSKIIQTVLSRFCEG